VLEDKEIEYDLIDQPAQLLSIGARGMSTSAVTANSGDDRWSRAALRIVGDTLQPSEINTRLGLEPTRSGIKGERFSSRHRAVRRTSFWLLQSPLSTSLPLGEHLNWLLDRFEARHDLITSIGEEFKVDFFCGFSSKSGQGGAIFDPALLRRLAVLGVPLVLDLYPPGAPLETDKELLTSALFL
jgi:hypothetical protein